MSIAILVVVFTIPQFFSSSTTKDIKKEITDKKPYMNFCDENGHVIESYSEDQMEDLSVDTESYKLSKEGRSGEV